MVIGICDDEQIFTDLLSDKIRSYMEAKGTSGYEIIIFMDREDLLENIAELDILFLDIEMGETDSGIQIKNQLASWGTDIRIVFVTSHCEMTEAAFGRNVYAFLQKKDIENRLVSVLDDVLRDFDTGQLELEDANGISRHIRPSQIRYIEVFNKYTQVCLKDNKLAFRLPLKEWWELLPSGRFGWASRYCIVNFGFLRGSVLKWNLTVDGKRIDVPKGRKRAFKEAYQQYMRER